MKYIILVTYNYKKITDNFMNSKHKGWLRVLLFILPYLFTVALFQVASIEITSHIFNDSSYIGTSTSQLISSFTDLLGTFTILWVFMKFIDKEKFVNLGFSTKKRFKEFVAGILIGLFIMGFGFFLLSAMNEINFQKFVFNTKEVIISCLLLFIVAIVEEALLRGYVLRNLMISFNKYIALVVSSLLFSLMHGFNPNVDLFSLFNLFLAGLVLGISYVHTKNLWFPIALHLSWNLFQTHFGFNVSGQDLYSLIEFSIPENNLLNGGAFGFEGSILSIILEILTFSGIAYYYYKSQIKKKI